MALEIIRNNIINVEADAIVNTANPNVAIGAGVDHDIFVAAGEARLLAARAEIGIMQPGDVASTPAFDLSAKYIIHVIGPAWQGGNHGERETVAACYSKSLALADELGCESIAFPLIATGTYGFPKDEALRIAIREISDFLLSHEMEVLLVVYDKESFELSGKLFADIREYIGEPEDACDSDDISLLESRTYDIDRELALEEKIVAVEDRMQRFGRRIREEEEALPNAFLDSEIESSEESFDALKISLDERLWHIDKTFQEYLFMLIDRRGLTDPEVYKKANIDRKHFSKIRSNVDYAPSKRTAVALAIALELSLDETKDLLSRAGLALSPSSVFDRIIEYCIENEIYDTYEINCILFKYDQPTLGV